VTSLTGVRDVTGDKLGRQRVTGLSPRTSKRTSKILSVDFSEETARQFEFFWQVYPCRAPHSNPRKPARQKFEAAVRRGVDPAAIIGGAEAYAAYVAAERLDPRFIKQTATWLHQECWTETHQPREVSLPVGMC
jgi:hypothetical protein